MARTRAVIFDVDGTLVDSNDIHARAWVEAFAEAGLDVPFGRVRPLIGMGGEKLVPAATGLAPDDPRVKQLGDRRSAIFRGRWLHAVRPFPHTRDLVQTLAKRHAIAIASSARAEELRPLLEVAGVADLVDIETSSSDAARSKPDPDIVCAALRRLGRPPEECVMVGDTRYDVEAARRAGVGLIGLQCGGSSLAELTGAIAIYRDPAHLLAELGDAPI